MKYLVTGSAGFIGNAVALSLLEQGHEVTGIDNMNAYYDPSLKRARHRRLIGLPYTHWDADLVDREMVDDIFSENRFDCVIHLAAQAGVRYSLDNPQAYVDSNITGFLNILEACRHHGVKRVFYASSSSVYGDSTDFPLAESHRTDSPISVYAASKKCNEHFAHVYSHLFGIQCIGLRFFSVYGPWGRPDMALFKFTAAMLNDEPIEVYNQGNHARDFTYISDIVDGINILLGADLEPTEIFNIGSSRPVELMEFIHAIQDSLGIHAIINYLPMQAGDVEETHADISQLQALGYQPKVSLAEGGDNFVRWYEEYCK